VAELVLYRVPRIMRMSAPDRSRRVAKECRMVLHALKFLL
jgi:hypothetical protein